MVPTLPNVVLQILALSDNPNSTMRDYERLILQDTAMAAKILRTANSSFYGGDGQITSLQRALQKLGTNTIRSICITVAYQSALKTKALPNSFNPARFWQHSLAVACAAKILAVITHDPQTEEAFVAGLLHDVGKLALCLFMPDEAKQVYDTATQQALSQYEAEQRCLGLTHQEIGKIAATCWSLPQSYHSPIARHHTPMQTGEPLDRLTAFVHVANALAYEIDLGMEPICPANIADPLVLDSLNIPQAQYDALKVALHNEVMKLSSHMGV